MSTGDEDGVSRSNIERLAADLEFVDGLLRRGSSRPSATSPVPDVVLPGPVLAAALIDAGAGETPVASVSVEGAFIVGPVDLSYRTLVAAVQFVDCVFSGPLQVAQCEVPALAFVGCEFLARGDLDAWLLGDRLVSRGTMAFIDVNAREGVLRLPGASIAGQLNFRNVIFGGYDGDGLSIFADSLHVADDVFMNSGFSSAGSVRLQRARLTQIHAGGAQIGADSWGMSLVAGQLNATGSVELSAGFVAEGSVDLNRSNLGGLDLAEATATHDDSGYAVHLAGAQVMGDVELTGLELQGAITLEGAYVRGSLEADSMTLALAEDGILFAPRLAVDGDLDLKSLVASGNVVLVDANVGGGLRLDDATIGSASEGDWSLRLDRARIGATCSLGGTFSASSAVNMSGMHVDEHLRMSGCTVTGTVEVGGDQTCSVAANDIRVGGSLAMDEGFSVTGPVLLGRAHITGQFNIDGQISGTNAEGSSIVADRLSVQGSLFVREGTVLAGSLRVPGARIGGQFNILGARLSTDGRQPALVAFRCVVADRGNVHCILGEGTLDFSDARFEGRLAIVIEVRSEAGLKAPLGVDARHIQVGEAFEIDLVDERLSEVFEASDLETSASDVIVVTGLPALPPADIDLSLAEVGKVASLSTDMPVTSLRLSGSSLGELNLSADGRAVPLLVAADHLRMGRVSGEIFQSRRRLRSWLATAPFDAAAWHAVASALEGEGRMDDGRWLRYHAEVERSRRRSPASRAGALAMRWTTGFGYYSRRALLCLLLCVAAATGLTTIAADEFTVRVTPTIAADIAAQGAAGNKQATIDHGSARNALCNDTWDVACLDTLDYAVTTVAPSPGFASSVWEPPPGSVTYLFMALRLAGWVFAALFIAGVTGILRTRH